MSNGALVQCSGITRAGKRCSITSSSALRDRTGEPIAAPLRRGCKYCSLHLEILATESMASASVHNRIVYFDLETTGLNASAANIVEIAAIDAQSGAVFSSTIAPTTESNDEAQRVNGILPAELAVSSSFPVVFNRLIEFLHHLESELALLRFEPNVSNQADLCCSRGDRFYAERGAPSVVLLVAHNAKRYDCVVLASECWRHGVDLSVLEK